MLTLFAMTRRRAGTGTDGGTRKPQQDLWGAGGDTTDGKKGAVSTINVVYYYFNNLINHYN